MSSSSDPAGGAASRRRVLAIAASAAALALGCGGAAPPAPAEPRPRRASPDGPRGPTLTLPERPADARGGAAVLSSTVPMRVGEREQAFERELLGGNVPAFLRRLVPVRLSGASTSVTVFVAPDYLAVGADDDFVRVPLAIRTAARIAAAAGCVFPTPGVVDAIYAAAEVKVGSPSMEPGKRMASTAYYLEHHRDIEERRVASGAGLGALVAGPKKDVVLTPRMLSSPNRTSIYGWFRTDGTAIQPLSLLHDTHHVDYTHGIRLVHAEALVGDERRPILELLRDRELCVAFGEPRPADLRLVWEDLSRPRGR